ncbi:HNH endonuclease [Haloarcula litorea]|uniref:HNH endonuclease n=1 Tax=Haloarcula litorea TaxID=3032579 RepID=UPI0023E85F98|nr:HNH endonuclease signature motif containing protein [Halomicroarcula sp. GDY20]
MGDHECPTCNREFDSRRGLGVHHSSVHDERLPNRECDECGDQFYAEYEKRYCSDDCRRAAVSMEGTDNPNYDGGKSETICDICGTRFEYYPSEKEGLYCGDCVETASWRDPPELSGTEHPAWEGGTLTLSCDVCDDPVERYPSQISGEVTLCSRDCHAEWLSEAFTGDGHPNWRGGGIDDYGPGWRETRERALERDGHACVVCGTDADDLGRNPDVHHVVPVRLFAASPVLSVRDAHTADNVVSLCPGCHRRAEFGRLSRAELRWRAGVAPPADRVRA